MIITKNFIETLYYIYKKTYLEGNKVIIKDISKKTGLGIQAVQRNIDIIINKELGYKRKEGRECYITLSEKGIELVHYWNKIQKLIEE